MLTSPDSSMIEGLSADELRWLEASQILETPSSTTSSTSPIDAVPSSRSTSASRNLPTPPRTPPRRSSPGSIQGSPSEWLYRRPKTSRTTPVTPILPSTLPLPREAEPAPRRDKAGTSPKAESLKSGDSPSNDTKASGNAPFWSNMLRPRSRSVRSIPLLKTIPSQSQVDIPPVPCDAQSISMSRRSPSVSSTSSSTLSSAASSSHPDTPVSAHPDPFGHFVRQGKGVYHRRHTSQPYSPRDYRFPPLSSSCPSKSILTRASSISTKDSAANKSVKFVEVPTVHYSSAACWGADATDRQPHSSSMGDLGMDIDDTPPRSSNSGGGGAWATHWGTATEFDMDIDPPPRMADEESKTGPLKRLMSFSSRRSSVSTTTSDSASLHHRKSSASTASSATITPSKPLPPTPSKGTMGPPPLPKAAISGPYVLGSHPAVPTSPAHSTASLRSTAHRHKPKSKSMSSGGLEDLRSSKNSAARSVRSLASVSSTATTSKLKSWMSKVGAGASWSRN